MRKFLWFHLRGLFTSHCIIKINIINNKFRFTPTVVGKEKGDRGFIIFSDSFSPSAFDCMQHSTIKQTYSMHSLHSQSSKQKLLRYMQDLAKSLGSHKRVPHA